MQMSSVFSLLFLFLAVILGFALGQQQQQQPIYRTYRQRVNRPPNTPAQVLGSQVSPFDTDLPDPSDAQEQSGPTNFQNQPNNYQAQGQSEYSPAPLPVRPFPGSVAMSTAAFPVYPSAPLGYGYPQPAPPPSLGLLGGLLGLKAAILPALVKGALVGLGLIFIAKLIFNLLLLPKTAAIAGAGSPQLIYTKTADLPLNSVDANTAVRRQKRQASPILGDGVEQLQTLIKVLENLADF